MKRFLTSDKHIGIFYIILASFGFALMGLFIRLAGSLPVIQKSFFRNLVSVAVSFAALRRAGVKYSVPEGSRLTMLGRVFFGTCGIFCNYYAIDHLNLADASMLNKLSPFFAILFSYLLLKERPSRRDRIAMVIAFIGALFVIRPGFTMSLTPALVGALGGMCAGMAYTCVRKLGTHGVAGPVIVLSFSVFSCLVCLPWLIAAFAPMTGLQLIYLLLAGASATLGQFGITTAYTHAAAKDISVFDYTQILFSALLSLLVYGTLPDALSFAGYAIIIGVAVWRTKK